MNRAAVLVLLLSTGCVSHPERPAPRASVAVAPPTLAEQAAAQEAATRPGREHKALDVLVGAWTASNVAVDERGNESDAVPGRAAIGWTLGGRYLRIDASLDLPGGASHLSSGFLGYDRVTQEYQWLMVSDLSTGMGVARGRGDVSRGGVRFVLDIVEPRTGTIARATSVLRAPSPDHLVLEIVGPDAAGLERVLRRTHYRRAG
ncbi:MAG: DUF1579 family protein [Planctomycetes bacterium]|nr:DUF1579 family protein [Planctomycetota bacterium]